MNDTTVVALIAGFYQAGRMANPDEEVTVPSDREAVSWAADLVEAAKKEVDKRHTDSPEIWNVLR